MKTNTKKLQEAILFICSKVKNPSDLGAIKLNKICWKADVENYLLTGKSITDSIYVKQAYGPVPKHLLIAKKELIDNKKIFERTIPAGDYEHKQLIPLEPPDTSFFDREELMCLLKHTLEISANHTASSVSKESHDIIWESAVIGEELPLYAYLAGKKNDINEEDINWAKNELGHATA